MRILIKIIDKDISVLLMDKKAEKDRIEFADERNLSVKLLPTVDKLLKRNKLRPEELKKVDVETNLGESYTSARIAQTVAKTFNWFLAYNKPQIGRKAKK